MSHRPEGIEIQFILCMTACLLLLAFRQECIKSEESRDGTVACRGGESAAESEENREEAVARSYGESSATLPDSVSHYSCGLVSLSGKKSQKILENRHTLVNRRKKFACGTFHT